MLCKWTKTIVQDKVCIDWTAAATAAIIYADNISQDIYASGYLKVDTEQVLLQLYFIVEE